MSRHYTISPDQVRGQEFRQKMRGYDPQQVRSYLHELADQLADMDAEVKRLRAGLTRLRQGPDNVTTPTGPPGDPGEPSVRLTEAETEASRIIARANEAAESIAVESQQRLTGLQAQIEELSELKQRMISQIETLLRSQLDHLHLLRSESQTDDDPTAPVARPILADRPLLDDDTV